MNPPSPASVDAASGDVPPHPGIVPVPAFNDNYIWLIVAADGRRAAVVDPGDAAPVAAALRERGLELAAVLVTHHHADHVGGLPALRDAWPRATVHGPAAGAIDGLDRRWRGGDRVELDGFDACFDVLDVPGHTLDHIAWFAPRIGAVDPRPVLFCGDTLFAGGCGRVFEGTPAQMHASLSRLAELPAQTLVYCAHEYTASNLRFAAAVEPGNAALAERVRRVDAARRLGRPTVPSTLALERTTNPFVRTGEPSVRTAAAERLGRSPGDEVEVFATVRQWKDGFRG